MMISVCLMSVLLAAEPTAQPSPREIAFTRDSSLWLIDVNTGDETLVTDQPDYDRPISWTSDGQYLLFWSHARGGWDTWRIKPDGSEAENLTNVQSGGCRMPVSSPDAIKIAYMRDMPEGLFVMNADGSNQRQLTTYSHRDSVPQWSPDGKKIAFVMLFSRDEARPNGIHVVSLDDEAVATETLLCEARNDPAWSHDGTSLIYVDKHDKVWDVFSIDVSTGETMQLTHTPEREYSALPSPDGKRVLVHRQVNEAESQLLLLNLDGSLEKELVTFDDIRPQAQWSPDGTQICYLTGPRGQRELNVLTIATGKHRVVSRGNIWFPQWRPIESAQLESE